MLCGKFPPEMSGKESLAFQHQLNRTGTQSERSLLSKLYQPRAPLGSPQVKEEDGGASNVLLSCSPSGHLSWGVRGNQRWAGYPWKLKEHQHLSQGMSKP